jgi:hypothetical protein
MADPTALIVALRSRQKGMPPMTAEQLYGEGNGQPNAQAEANLAMPLNAAEMVARAQQAQQATPTGQPLLQAMYEAPGPRSAEAMSRMTPPSAAPPLEQQLEQAAMLRRQRLPRRR